MNKVVHFSLISLLLLFATERSESQTQQGYYMHIDYVHIEKEKIPIFEEQIVSTLKPVQEARISQGSVAEWYIYRVAYPGTQHPNYNYVMISLDSSLDDFGDAHSRIAEQLSENFSNEHIDEFKNLLIPYRSELWRINNSVLLNDSSKASKYLVMDYMKVPQGMEYAYQMMEDEIALPIHSNRMEANQMNGWELFNLIAPGGTEYGYSFATGNYFSNLSHFEFGFTEEIMRLSHPGTDINELNQNIDQTRDLVRSEVWELIDYAK